MLLSAALVATLTGCGDGEEATTGKRSDAPAANGRTTKAKPFISLSAAQVRSALPTDYTLGDALVGDDPTVIEGQEARQNCAESSGASCGGLVAGGKKELGAEGPAGEGHIEFTLYSFDSPGAASAVRKSLAATARASVTVPKQVEIASGADETEAFKGTSTTHVVMRLGSVVAHVRAVDTTTGTVHHVATHQIDLIKDASGG
ncbi:hypothetical protein ACFWIA_01560 [Streptomyces sp. NPDC127068]|uniref:hypothetical protein n=1 Tax=Streptomyces sp. NPDC127068 TaxID=3347127 RepID=UPI00365974F2